MAVSELSGGLWHIEPLWGELEELLGCPFALFGGGLGKGGAEGDAQAGGPSERSTELHWNYQDNPMKQTGKPIQRRDAENAEETQRKARTRWTEGAGFSPLRGWRAEGAERAEGKSVRAALGCASRSVMPCDLTTFGTREAGGKGRARGGTLHANER